MKKQLNFTVSGETIVLMDYLRKEFNVETNTAVLIRALAIARLVARHQRDDHTITMIGKDEISKIIVLNC